MLSAGQGGPPVFHPAIDGGDRSLPSLLDGRIERLFRSSSGYLFILGWVSDEGSAVTSIDILIADVTFNIPSANILRHARPDVEKHNGRENYDYGFLAFARLAPLALLAAVPSLTIRSVSAMFVAQPAPETVTDKRLLDALLTVLHASRSNGEKEVRLRRFLTATAGEALVGLYRSHVEHALAGHHIERYRPCRRDCSFVTVLFGTAEPMLLQPILFRQQGIDNAEWIYVCNSPEDAAEALRLGRMLGDLYDLTITVIVMAENVGFGAANNLAIEQAVADRVYLINPDVYPLASEGARLKQALEASDLGRTLWGGLLFYDEARYSICILLASIVTALIP